MLSQIARRSDGDLRAARVEAYRQIDPLIRGWVRSRVSKAVASVLFETERGDDERHVHRLAYLRVSGARFGHPDEVEAIEARFEKHAKKKPPARFGPSLFVLASLVASCVLATGLGYWRMRPPASLHERAAANPDAWESGGRPPEGDEATRELFERTLPGWAVELDRVRTRSGGGTVELDRAVEQVSSEARTAGGESLSRALVELSGRSREYVEAGDPSRVELTMQAVGGVDRAVREAALGYYVDVEFTASLPPRVLLATYTVEGVRFYRSGETRERALRIRRLDHLNHASGLLGYTRPGTAHGLVLVDRVEHHLVRSVLPALEHDAEMPLTDVDSRGEFWATQAQMLAARSAREELSELVGEHADRLGRLFATRERVLSSWRERLEGRVHIRQPGGFDFEISAFEPIRGRVPSDEWRELANAHEESRDDSLREAYRAVEEVFLQSVERHEVQHRLDYGAGRLEAIPPELEVLTGPLLDADGHKNMLAQRSVAELSAYLSELVRGPDIVRTNLALFAGHALNPRSAGTRECNAALVVLTGLSAELELPVAELVVRRRIDRSAVSAALVALHGRPPAELVAAASRLWARLFGEPLPELALE